MSVSTEGQQMVNVHCLNAMLYVMPRTGQYAVEHLDFILCLLSDVEEYDGDTGPAGEELH